MRNVRLRPKMITRDIVSTKSNRNIPLFGTDEQLARFIGCHLKNQSLNLLMTQYPNQLTHPTFVCYRYTLNDIHI